MSSREQTFKIALAGSPNCGKTSLFNGLTGSSQHVGNYPGVTVERRTGKYLHNDYEVEVRDLPGTYSLSSYSPEERIAQNELVDEEIDVIVQVVDATMLSRSLVMLVQVVQISNRIVLCLNMSDEARKSGQRLNLALLEQLLNIPVVETVGHRKQGLDALKEKVQSVFENPPKRMKLVLGERLDNALSDIKTQLVDAGIDSQVARWYATRLLQNDNLYVERVLSKGEKGKQVVAAANTYREAIERLTDDDIMLYMQQRYYGFVDGLLREVTIQTPYLDTRQLSDRIDAIVVHRVMGLPIFFGIMYAIFWLTFTVGAYPMEWIDAFFCWIQEQVMTLWPDGQWVWLRSLVVDGVIGGVGGVLVFLPNITLLFLGLAILQDSGYMSRAAFLSDKLMHKFGLHGKSFIPLITGFGCTIPGIMATRTMENERDRLTTMMVLPLMSCGARLPIWLLLIPSFFPASQHATMLFVIYFTGIAMAFLLALMLRKTLFKGEEAPFVMELPPYRMPTARSVWGKILLSAGHYVQKAGTVILAISVVMWFLTSYPQIDAQGDVGDAQSAAVETEEQSAFHQLEQSYAGRIGRFIEPAIAPLGFDWKIGVATIGAFMAKEVFVSQMGVIYALGESNETDQTLRGQLRRDYSPLIGFSLMVFLLIAAPCMATVAVTKQESGHWKWAAIQLVGLTAIGYICALLVFQIGSLFLS